jgi:hypothetical protein
MMIKVQVAFGHRVQQSEVSVDSVTNPLSLFRRRSAMLIANQTAKESQND